MQIDRMKLAEWIYYFETDVDRYGIPITGWGAAVPSIKKGYAAIADECIEFCCTAAEPEEGV